MTQLKRRQGRPNIVGIDKGMGPLEAQIMRTISKLPSPVTVREVCDALGKDGYFAYQGVLNCMNRLVKKGILSRRREGVAYVYEPLIDAEELAAQVVSNVLAHMGGRLDRVICRVLDIDPEVGEGQIAELRRRVQSASKTKRR
ncbi:MAG: BlaI/MecI/CopY family transcriptional regulator [Armatimonadota bacterium]